MRNRNRYFLASIFTLASVAAQTASALPTDLLISEYVEGSGYNKAVEIYNGTGSPVDLSGYELQFYFNGNTTAGHTLGLTGTLASGDVFVVAEDAADPALRSLADQLDTSTSWFNGDDAVVLAKGSAAVDSIGQVGFDPGSQWGSGDTSTQNNTLRRVATVCSGDTDPSDSFDPAAEWVGYAQDTFDGLGSHTASCGSTPPPVANVLIHEVQGSGDSSPLVGQTVAVDAIVVGDFQGASGLDGFFIQEEDSDADSDPLTSEGIFVYQGPSGTDVSVGDRVQVTGTVTEYSTLTELTGVSVSVVSSGNALPSATQVTLPVASISDLERYEGMRVTLPQTLTVTENYNLGRYGEVWLSSGGRLMTPTNVAQPGAAALAQQAANDLNRLLIDDGSTVQNPNPIVYPSPGLTAYNTLRVGDRVTSLTGVMHYGFGNYLIEPTATPNFVADNPRTQTPATINNSTLKVASFNVLNYFNGDGQGGGFPTARGATTIEEFDRQRNKIIAAITAMDADIIGLMELENDGYDSTSAIADLVNGLNAAAPSGTSYAYINPGVSQIGSDAITVGLIYRTQTVTPLGSSAILDSSVDARFIDTKNRPTLAQTFQQVSNGARLTVAVNHLKSKGSACDDVGDPDTGDGQGNCNLTRTAAAQALTDWLATDPTQSGDSDFLIIGDLNSYAKEDPITAIKSAGYADLIDTFIGANSAYSYVFNGQSGYLDHALASSSLAGQVAGVTEWHINPDEPHVLDYNTEYKSASQVISLYNADPYRASDHDPVIIGLNLEAAATSVSVSDLDGSSTAINARHWQATATVTVKDDQGRPSANSLVSATWTGKNNPVAASCTTNTTGQCVITETARNSVSALTLNVDSIDHSGLSYNAAANSDPDGDSNGTSITVGKP